MTRLDQNIVSTLKPGYLLCTVYVEGLKGEWRTVYDVAVLLI